MSNHKATQGLTELMNAADKILNQQGFIKDDPPKASDLWDIPSEAYDAAEQLLQEQETGGKKDDQDELWTEAGLIIIDAETANKAWVLVKEDLKSKYTITRKTTII